MVLTGVWYLSCTLASQLGKEPERAIAYSTRVPAFVAAIPIARIELTTANRTMIHASPHSRVAKVKTGLSAEDVNAGMSLVPHPTSKAQPVKT